MAEARHRNAKNRSGCAAGNRITLFYQEGLAAPGAPCCLMPNLATAGASCRARSGGYGSICPTTKKRAADLGRPEIAGIFWRCLPITGLSVAGLQLRCRSVWALESTPNDDAR